MHISDPMDEILPIVDKKDNVIGQITRKKAHNSPHAIHRSVSLLIYDHLGRLLIQKRSLTKDTFPGHWALSVEGHVGINETYINVVFRESQEELGIILNSQFLTPLGKIITSSNIEQEMTQVYTYQMPIQTLIYQNSLEITKIRFVTLKSLNNLVTSLKWSENALQILNHFVF